MEWIRLDTPRRLIHDQNYFREICEKYSVSVIRDHESEIRNSRANC